MKIVALGGGHGLAASLAALRRLTAELTAVVTVADDGGSSGRLRATYDLLPPGDLRMALTALAGEHGDPAQLAAALSHRFGPESGAPGYGGLAGHAVGNLLLAGLIQVGLDPVAALALVGRLLGFPPGTSVLPMCCLPLDIAAEVGGLAPNGELVTIRGQVEVATTRGRVVAVHLLPADPPACPQALAAVGAADALVLGPGSLFTSVLPHLLLPQLRAALTTAAGCRVLVLNLVAQHGETDGFSAESHLEVIGALVPELRVDWVLADADAVPADARRPLLDAAQTLGAAVHFAPLAHPGRPGVHDASALAAALGSVLAH